MNYYTVYKTKELSMADLDVFGFEKDDIKSGLFEKYKGKKGEIHRCAIIFNDPKAMFVGSKIHFHEKYFLCKKGKCCEVCGPARWRIGSVLIKYSTDKNGTPKKPFSFDLYPWIFNEQNFTKLKTVNEEFPLTTHDINIACTVEEYQTLSITPCKESLWTLKEEFKRSILEQAKPIWDSLKKSIAQDLSVEEINELLGSPSAAAVDPSAGVTLDDVLGSV